MIISPLTVKPMLHSVTKEKVREKNNFCSILSAENKHLTKVTEVAGIMSGGSVRDTLEVFCGEGDSMKSLISPSIAARCANTHYTLYTHIMLVQVVGKKELKENRK